MDASLETVRLILEEREAVTSNMHEAALALDFDLDVTLDDERFGDLLRILPSDMAPKSQRWVAWFLGRQDGRRPVTIQGGEIVLRETLACNNAFRTGDCAELTKEEEAEIERILDSRRPPSLDAFLNDPSPQKIEMSKSEDVPPESIQWFIGR